jgi:hypothetical protein
VVVWSIAAGVGALVLAVWLMRGPIASHLARQWLRERGVSSELKNMTISPRGLSARVRLGERSNPDVSVDHLEVGYDLTGPWEGRAFGVKVKSLRLVRPWVRLRLGPGHPMFGALQPLIDQLSKQPGGGAPPPDITIEDGQVLVLTGGGSAQFNGDAQITAGVLRAMNGTLGPFGVTLGGVRLRGAGGMVEVTSANGRLKGSVDLRAIAIGPNDRQLRAGRAVLNGTAPYPGKDGSLAGPVDLALAASGLSGFAGAVQGAGGGASARLTGMLEGDRIRQTVVGALKASGRMAVLMNGAGRGQEASLDLDLPDLALRRVGGEMGATGDGTGRLALGGVASGDGLGLSGLASRLRIGSFEAETRAGETHLSARLDGDLAGAGAASRAKARRLAKAVPLLSGEARYASAMERALRGFRLRAAWRADLSDRGLVLKLVGPARVDAASGAQLAVADPGAGVRFAPRGVKGAADLAASGGGLPDLKAQLRNAAYASGRFAADLATEDALDVLFAKGATLKAKGRLTVAQRRVRFDLAACAPVTAERLDFDPNAVTRFSGAICPGGGPAILAGPDGWRAAGAVKAARGDVASLDTDFRQADGRFEAAGPGGGVSTVALALGHGWAVDAKRPLRFNPVQVSGRADLARAAWTGAFAVASGGGRPVGALRLRQDTRTGVGRIDIDARGLAFASDGLQPTALTPLAASIRQVEGPAPFTGWFAWGPRQASTSGGELVLRDARLKGPLGPMTGVSADIRFDSLAPLTTPPGQTLSVAQIQTITPMTAVSAAFALRPDAIALEAAQGTIAEGQVRLEPTVVPLTAKPAFTAALDLEHVAVGEIIAASSLAKSVQLDARVDGRIPIAVKGDSLTITDGHIATIAPGRLTIARTALSGVAASGAASAAPGGQAGFAQDMAYQALEDLAFDQMNATLNSQPGERLGVLFHIRGRHDPPKPQQATIAISDLIAGKAFSKPLPLPSGTAIDLTLDTSLNFGELMRGLAQAWRDSQAGAYSAPVQGPPAEVTSK